MSILCRVQAEHKGFVDAVVYTTFGTTSTKNPKKIKIPAFAEAIDGAWAHGIVTVTEAILNEHKENPYKNIDEMRGDLMVMLETSYARLRSGICGARLPLRTIAEIIDTYEVKND